MTMQEVWSLHTGDEVFWNDPDDGLCSRLYVIQSIRIDDDIITITEPDGSELQCFASELS